MKNTQNVSTLMVPISNFLLTNSLFHINIGSLQKHIDSLKTLLEETESNFDLIVITETRIKFDGIPHNLDIDN